MDSDEYLYRMNLISEVRLRMSLILLWISLSWVVPYAQFMHIGQIDSSFRQEVNFMGSKPELLEAFRFIADDSVITRAEHIALTEISAPPFQESRRAAAFAQMLSSAGVDSVWTDAAGNVIGLIRGTRRNRMVVLDGHLDTVFPEETDVRVRQSGDTLYAPGIGDNTRGLAVVLSVARAICKTGIAHEADIVIIGTVGEEGPGDLRGVKHLFSENSFQIDSWISIDGGGIGRITSKGLGSYRYRVTFKGPGGHSWGAFGLANPIHAAATAIHMFTEEADKFVSQGQRTTYNVGVVEGGTSVNSIPFSASFDVDLRSESHARLDSIADIFLEAMAKGLEHQNRLATRGKPLELEVQKTGDRPSGELSDHEPIVQRAMAAAAYLGKVPTLIRGSTNANIPIARGVPAVTIGRGGKGANAHALDEWWLDEEGYKAIQMACLLLIMEARASD